ncbi:TPA: hypothetical protein ACXDAY_002330 [Clostridium botulinum]|uniref:hypothetical protein n=1 Tax=Clostridium botulinum TaxID=1491 RepID=UPI0004660928|nr:hypothetical protein [Clostridium botulinum]APR02540.1 hypothetical protein RSJ2_4140 [Clostridium botulinum]AUN01643.1 hypothetical protein RSJ19_01310 [Clostridium botulinum]MBN3359365.1 hypothetical protein [Clostridium botulinum]QDY27211.1 hypothetical protein CGQ40_21135 [Clostridium botulinum]
MDNNFYVYEWYNVDNKEVFYVGKGKNKRYKNTTKRNQYFKNYYNKYECDVRKVKENLTEKEAFNYEIEVIEKYRNIGQCKCNLTNGGEGATFPEGSWNDLFRKLQYLHDVKCAMDDMDNEEEYDIENLKTKTLKELKELYKNYIEYKDNEKLNKEYFKSIDIQTEDLTGFELKTQNEEIVLFTELIANDIAKSNKEFSDFLNWKSEVDFICIDFNSDKFLKLMFDNTDYYNELIKVITNVLWFMKNISSNKSVRVPIVVKSYVIKNNYIHIKFNTYDDKTLRRVKIHLYDIVWGILMFKDKALFEIIYNEVFFAPFI